MTDLVNRQHRLTEKQQQAILKDYQSEVGMTIDAIAKKHGIHKTTLYRVIHRLERKEENNGN